MCLYLQFAEFILNIFLTFVETVGTADYYILKNYDYENVFYTVGNISHMEAHNNGNKKI